MSTTSISRLALALSIVSLALALLTLLGRGGEPRRGANGQAPEPRRWADESVARDQALAADIAGLRSEIAALPAPSERRVLEPLVARGADAAAAKELATPAERAADDPAQFQLRRELLEGFHELGNGDREDAIDRLAELARWGDAEAKALILASVTDPSAGVRARALKEALDLDEPNLGAYLRGSIGDPSGKVREVVAGKLDELPVEEAGPLLLGLLQDPDADVVMEAIESLDDLDHAEARPALVEQLQSDSLDVATRAAQALRKLGDEAAATGVIERVLRDYAKDDVSGRANNVKRLRRLRAVGSLESILASDASLTVREEARKALASLEE